MPIDTDSLTHCIGTMESALYDISWRNAESAAWVHNQLVRVNTRMDRKDGPPRFHRGVDVEQFRPQRPTKTQTSHVTKTKLRMQIIAPSVDRPLGDHGDYC